MKFGVVIHKPTMNLADDIQTYAAAKLLPHVDYQIDREYISDFKKAGDSSSPAFCYIYDVKPLSE